MTGSVRRLDFLVTADAIDPRPTDGLRVVLDSAWTPGPEVPPDVVAVRPAFAVAIEERRLHAEALAVVDGWARDAGAADRLAIDGVSSWFRLREPMWHWVHQRLLWLSTLAAIEDGRTFDVVRVPWSERALVDVLRAQGRVVEATGAPGRPRQSGRRPPRSLRRVLRRLLRRLVRGTPAPGPRPATSVDSDAARPEPVAPEPVAPDPRLSARIDALLAEPGPRAIVLTVPSSYQRLGRAVGGVRLDPNLGSVIPALGEVGIAPIVVGLGASADDPAVGALLEDDERLLPGDAVRDRWGRPGDAERAAAATAAVEQSLAALAATPLLLRGLDATAAFMAALRHLATRVAAIGAEELAMAERMLVDVRPAALITTHEHHRTPWLVAARRAGVATFALQHGILYATHPGYPGRRHPALVLPDVTFTFGDFERRVLVDMGYREDEVAVSGSPRLDLDCATASAEDVADDERAAVRAELGVRDGDRLLVISTMPIGFVRRSHFVHMIERVLGGPLPGLHLVFKQHPGERDAGPYRDLLDGLARVGGYPAPPISVVQDVDLYRLLRAADAHLGLASTVLTDAVMAGTPNLIAAVEPRGDLLGYAEAGVATPVVGTADLLEAMRDPRPAPPAARAAFLADHFREGPAGRRIAEAVRARVSPPDSA